MEGLVALSVGALIGCGVYLLLRAQTFSVVLGLTLLSYGVNLFLFISGRLRAGAAPLIDGSDVYADPLPQALVLTAIVIGFAMTAYLVALALRVGDDSGNDDVDGNVDGSVDSNDNERASNSGKRNDIDVA